jgi:putative tricarboxylic transport membrane protein
MRRFNNGQVASAIWLLAGIVIVLKATTSYRLGTLYAPETGFMPFLAGAAMCLFSFIGLVHATVLRKKGIEWKPVFDEIQWPKSLMVFGALLFYALLLSRLGFLLCTFLFLGFLFRSVKPMRWGWVLSGSVFFTLTTYGIFELWLKAQLPRGLWGF